MKRLAILIYGLISYVTFLASFLYALGFIECVVVPKTIDTGSETDILTAIAIILALLSVFAIQHSVMAQPFFKRSWATVISPAAERSTYVLLSSLILLLFSGNGDRFAALHDTSRSLQLPQCFTDFRPLDGSWHCLRHISSTISSSLV